MIIDFVMPDAEQAMLIDHCKQSTIIKVGIKPPLEEVIKREKVRGDRKIGIAEVAYERFYQNKTFDLQIDTKEQSPSAAAEMILNFQISILATGKHRK